MKSLWINTTLYRAASHVSYHSTLVARCVFCSVINFMLCCCVVFCSLVLSSLVNNISLVSTHWGSHVYVWVCAVLNSPHSAPTLQCICFAWWLYGLIFGFHFRCALSPPHSGGILRLYCSSAPTLIRNIEKFFTEFGSTMFR